MLKEEKTLIYAKSLLSAIKQIQLYFLLR